LKTEQIGKLWIADLPPVVAIHENKVIEPMGIFYNSKYNIIIIHGITVTTGSEWDIAEAIVQIAKDLKAKEIISLEGVGSAAMEEETKTFFYTNQEKNKDKLQKAGTVPLKEGIIMGVTGSLLLKADGIKLSCIFAETHSQLPDSKAAAKIIEVLDKYLGLNIDYKPLLKQAEKFEAKLKGLLQKSQEAQTEQEKKQMSYVG